MINAIIVCFSTSIMYMFNQAMGIKTKMGIKFFNVIVAM